MSKIENKFEATMMAVQKAKLQENKKSSGKKSIKENKKTAKKKASSRTERILRESKRMLTEDEDVEIDIDPEEGLYDDVDVEVTDDVDDTDVAEDVSDEVVAVVDPDLDAADYEDRIDELEEIIEETPVDEVPVDEDYVGEEIFECPVCGNAFFSENDMNSGGTCPVCGEDVDQFITVGEVTNADVDGEIEDEIPEDDIDLDTDDVEELPEEDVDIDDVEDIPEEDEDLDLEEGCSSDADKKYSKFDLDESKLNKFFTKFITENYKNAKNMTVTKAYMNGNRLRLECKIRMKSGAVKNTTVRLEGFRPAFRRTFKMRGYLGNGFKLESRRKSSFEVTAYIRNNNIVTESFKYDYNIRKEGKRYNVSGNYRLVENKKRRR